MSLSFFLRKIDPPRQALPYLSPSQTENSIIEIEKYEPEEENRWLNLS